MICCVSCKSEMFPDARADELRAGKLRYLDSAGHARYVDVPPVQTAEEAELDEIIAGDRAHREDLARARPACDICAQPMLLIKQGQMRHAACVPEADRRRLERRREKDKAARRGRPTAWSAERISQLYSLWVEGASPVVMGEAVGLSPRSVYPQVTELRKAGYDFPERPRGGAAVAARAR